MNKNTKLRQESPSLKEKVETIVFNSTPKVFKGKLTETANNSAKMDRSQMKATAGQQDTVWLENQIKQYELSEYNTKQLLAKAAPLFKIDNQGKFIKPSFVSTVINWKLILDILLELLYKYIQANKTDKMLWDSHKK